MWVFLRSLSLHLQICWQVVVGRNFMWFSQATGWGIPIVGIIMALVFSGVSFRFGSTCHINHENSLADLWVPLLIFAGLTIFIQFATFGYCIKVYLASLADNSASTENSNLPSYTNSIRTMTPKQAYRRVRRVIQLQWRGIAIVLIIVTDVVLFSVVFVFQDNTVEAVRRDPSTALEWVACLAMMAGDKNKCLDKAGPLVVDMPTVGAVLLLLSVKLPTIMFYYQTITKRSNLINYVLDKRLVAFAPPRSMVDGDGMARPPNDGSSAEQARIRLRRRTDGRSQERHTFVRDAVPGKLREKNGRLSNTLRSDSDFAHVQRVQHVQHEVAHQWQRRRRRLPKPFAVQE